MQQVSCVVAVAAYSGLHIAEGLMAMRHSVGIAVDALFEHVLHQQLLQ
jgi:hypothetical protein